MMRWLRDWWAQEPEDVFVVVLILIVTPAAFALYHFFER